MEHVRGLWHAGRELFSQGSPEQQRRTTEPFSELRVAKMPVGWNGAPRGALKDSQARFPCFGKDCAAAGAWHKTGTKCQAFKDVGCSGPGCWQHMCEPCFAQRGEVPENVWPKQVAEAATQGQALSPGTQFAELQADPELEAAIAAALLAPTHHDEDGVRPTASRSHNATCTRCGQTAPTSQKLRCVRPHATLAPFSSRLARLGRLRRLRRLRLRRLRCLRRLRRLAGLVTRPRRACRLHTQPCA